MSPEDEKVFLEKARRLSPFVSKRLKEIGFKAACKEVIGGEGIKEDEDVDKLISMIGGILGKLAQSDSAKQKRAITRARKKQQKLKLMKAKQAEPKLDPLVVERFTKPISKEQQQMFAGVTAFMQCQAKRHRHLGALSGNGYRPGPHRWRQAKP